jgi:glycosyltransferase involved in cell wall biosynthesis
VRLLTCITTYNQPRYLPNAVDSTLELFRHGDLVISDTGSDSAEQLDYLEGLERRGLPVLRRDPGEVVRGALYANLYPGMNAALDFAQEGGYDVVQFVQDDMQFTWHDPELPAKVELIFAARSDAAQVTTTFFKQILYTIRARLEFCEDVRAYHVRPYGMSDLGFVRVDLLDEHGFRFNGSENETSAFWRERDYRLYSLHSPVLAWLPTHLDGIARPRVERFYLKPLDDGQIARLTSRPLAEVPYHEDWCLPWGWACLRPYWFTRRDAEEYFRLLLGSFRARQPLLPRWVSAGKPAYHVPGRRWLAVRVARLAWAALRGHR